jgi:uncharacterized protein (DUF58 family)
MLEARAFEPQFLERLDRLVLGIRRARALRPGSRTLGRMRGAGLELESFKDYVEGDDLRFLDWSALARLDDLFIRTYRPEREVEVSILIDASASMDLPRGDDKFGLARALGAALAYVAMSDHDAVRLVGFGMRRGAMKLSATPFFRRRESFPGFKPFLTALTCAGDTRLAAAAGELLLERRPRGLAIVISDFLVSPLDYEQALDRLIAAHHEVKVVHVLGGREASGDYPPGLYRIRDSETGELREVVFGAETAAACRARAERLSARVRAFCDSRSIAYIPAFGAGRFEEIVERDFPRLGIVR